MRRRRGWGQHLPQHERHHADARVDSASATPRIRRTPGGGSSGASCDAPFGIDAQIDANAILHFVNLPRRATTACDDNQSYTSPYIYF